jgi:Ring finger domain
MGECRHVFHHECLEEWLTNPKHDDCPACRCQIIHDEGDDSSSGGGSNCIENATSNDVPCDTPGNYEIERDESDNGQSLVFVIMHGLISPLRRARNSFVETSSVLMTGDDIPLRRVLSTGHDSVPSRIGVALRHVSSGLYSHWIGSSSSRHLDDSPLHGPAELRRTKSEGLPRTPKQTNMTQAIGRSSSNIDDIPESLHLELGSESEDCMDHITPKPRMFRLGFRRFSTVYTRIACSNSNLEELSDDDDIDEDSLESTGTMD